MLNRKSRDEETSAVIEQLRAQVDELSKPKPETHTEHLTLSKGESRVFERQVVGLRMQSGTLDVFHPKDGHVAALRDDDAVPLPGDAGLTISTPSNANVLVEIAGPR